MHVDVLRLGHRIGRDERTTTHVCLVSRAFGASSCIVTGESAEQTVESVRRVSERWGGEFEAVYSKGWKPAVNSWKKKFPKGKIVHLTMYGERVQDKTKEIAKLNVPLLVIVGGEKVPYEIYQMADYNISVTSQPHSEVAALAVFLDRVFEGKELEKKFGNAKIRVTPSARGKIILEDD